MYTQFQPDFRNLNPIMGIIPLVGRLVIHTNQETNRDERIVVLQPTQSTKAKDQLIGNIKTIGQINRKITNRKRRIKVMSLLETLKNVKAEGYDPKKDRINNGGLLETGVYPVRLISAERDVNKRGQEQVIVKLEVVSGNFAERKETLFLSFDSGLPEFVLERN